MRDGADEKDQIKWKLSSAGALMQNDLGDPATSRAYTLCIYDEIGSVALAVAGLDVGPSATWVSKAPKGFDYKDKSGSENGATKVQLRTGAAGKSKASFAAKGLNIPMPTPFSATKLFNQDAGVIVQLVNDETATCWTSEFTAATKNDDSSFKAKAP